MNLKRIDVLAIVSTVAMCSLLGCVGLTQQSRSQNASSRMVCLNNLKAIGLATRIGVIDPSGSYLMNTPVKWGGSKEWVEAGEIWRHYLALSNVIGNASGLVCPDDTRTAASSWIGLTNNQQISYFVGMATEDTRPNMLLSGDRNIALHGKLLAGVVSLGTNAPIHWTANDIHQGEGNIGYADGSVQQFTTEQLQTALARSGDSTNRLVSP